MKQLSLDEVNRINRLLLNSLRVGDKYILQEIESTLKYEGIKKNDYGFKNVEEFVRNLPCFDIDAEESDSITMAKYNGQEATDLVIAKKENSMENEEVLPTDKDDCDEPEEKNERLLEALSKFAFLAPDRDAFYEKLAKEAMKETWNYPFNCKNNYLLERYLRAVFYRLKCEGKIAFSIDKKFAAINTGLVNDRYQEIFVCFERNESQQDCEYISTKITSEKEDIAFLGRPPKRISFFNNPLELYFDTSISITFAWKHIILDHLERYPLDFLRRNLNESHGALFIIDRIEKEKDQEEKKQLFKMIGEIVKNDSECYLRIRESLERAVEITIARIKNNFMVAVPGYYPSRNSISLFIPICLSSPDETSLVLVVERRRWEYIGFTVLSPIMAYSGVRVLLKPEESSWIIKCCK